MSVYFRQLGFQIFLLFFGLQLRAQEISFSRITDGLSSSYVNCITQSKDGYIWVGTANGLHRYDGYRFRKLFKSVEHNQLPVLPVDQVFALDHPSLLLLRMGQRIGVLDTRSFVFLDTRIDTQLSQLDKYGIRIQASQKDFYLIIPGQQLLVYNAEKNSFSQDPKKLTYPKDWHPTSVFQQKDGRVWIGGSAGLGYFDPARKVFHAARSGNTEGQELSDLSKFRNVTHFTIDNKGRFFICSWPVDQGYKLFLYNPEKRRTALVKAMPRAGSNYHELSYFKQERGFVWGYGLDVFNYFDEQSGNFESFFNPESAEFGIRVNYVHQIFRDREENLWVATDNGLYLMSVIAGHLRNGDMFGDFESAPISTMLPLASNQILFGSWGKGLASLKYDSKLRMKADSSLPANIYRRMPNDPFYKFVWAALQQHSTGKIWVACQAGRLICYDTKSRCSEFLAPKVFRSQTITTMALDGKGDLWLGSHHGLLIKSHQGGFKLVAELSGSISKILPGPKGNLWVGTSGNGLFELDVSNLKIRNHLLNAGRKDLLSSDRIQDLALLNDSLLAIACSSGLDILNLRNHSIEKLHVQNGLPHGIVNSMSCDAKGFLWLATTGGIYRYNVHNREFRFYDKTTGMPGASGTNLMNRSVVFPDGKIGFAGKSNFVIFDPLKVSVDVPPQPLTITDFKLSDHYIPMDSVRKLDALRLRHDENYFSIYFAPLSYGKAGQLKYYYKLQGAGQQWIRAEQGMAATFAYLSPGSYTFLARSENTAGQFSKAVKLKIVIAPPFYQTWWFILLIGLLLAASVYLAYRAKVKRLLELQKLREKVARDLHDDVGSTLTSINILSSVALYRADDPVLAREYLDKIGKSSAQMMESMDDIVWSIKPDNDQLSKIAARMREYASSVLEPKHISYRFLDDESIRSIKLSMERRRDLFLIYKESLNNIVKYARAKTVEISLKYLDGKISLVVADNGCGFDMSKQSSGNGLTNMQQRARLLQGELTISSELGRGTTISLTIQLIPRKM